MPIIKSKAPKAKTKKAQKSVSRSLVKAQPKSRSKSQSPAAYFNCMKACCQKGIKPKKITEIARECKHNALAINAKMSAQKTQAVKKIQTGYEQLGKGLSEFIKAAQ